MREGDTMLKVDNLVVSVANKKILKGLDLKIEDGTIHVIMGPNGTGKSTLSKVIIGNDHYIIDKGDILVDGKSIKDIPTYERARMGIFLCFQSPVAIEGISNSEFIRTAMNANTEKPVGLYSFIKDLEKNIDSLKMDKEMMHRSLNQGFSGGERKKNEILQILMLKPKLIIFDELDSGLDVDSLKIVCDNINRYLSDNPETSILFITHYTRILNYVKPTHVHMMNNGTIVKSGNFDLALEIEKNGYHE